MKRLAGTLAVFVLLLQGGLALAQTSDYEVIDSYKKKQQALAEAIREAQNPERCVSLYAEIDSLEADYGPHSKLLSKGLHPESLDSSVAALREQLKKRSERLSLAEQHRKAEEKIEVMVKKTEEDTRTITKISQENQEFRVQVDRLTQEIQSLSQQVEKLEQENTGLIAQVKALQAENRKDKESIAKLKALTEKLNANIRDRDEAIVRMMDAMTKEYEKAGMTDEQKKNLFVNVQGNDYVGKILSTVDGNVKYSEATVMTAADLEAIRGEHRKLSSKWDDIKPYVGKLYADEQTRVRDLASVDSRLGEWKRQIDEGAWKGIYQAFVAQNVDIGPFRTAEEFHARLLAYIDQQVQSPSRDKYLQFKTKVWDSPMKDQWLPIISTDELTETQRADIEARIVQWDKAISAVLWRWVLIGAVCLVVVLALVAFAVVAARKKKAGTPTP